VNVYGLSWHFDRDKAKALGDDNGFNPGLGVRWQPEKLSEKFSWFVDAGAYHDSGRNTAVLAGAGVHWHATEQLRLGGALAFLNSQTYNSGKSFIAPLPIAAWDFGRVTLNMVYMPKVHDMNDINTLGFWATVWLQ
jgi:hypothetical protein